MQEIASLFAKISADVGDFEKGMKKVKDDMSMTEKGMSGLQSAIGTGLKVAAGVGIAAVAGLATGIGHAVQKAADMEQGIANISAVMQLSSEETVELKDLIMDLGLDPKLKVSATEAAQAIEVLGTAGLTMDEILGGAAISTVLLANATGADFAQAGEIASDVMAQFNIKAEDMDSMINQIVGTTIQSKMTIDDYGLAIGTVGGTAAALGMSLPDLNAVLAVTASSFGGGTNSATALRTMLTRLVPASNEAHDVMSSLDLITVDWTRAAADLSGVLGYEVEPNVNAVFEAFSKTETGMGLAAISQDKLAKGFNGLRAQYEENQFFDDVTGAMVDNDEMARVLQDAFGGLTEEQRNSAGATIFGVDAMNMAFAMMKGGMPAINDMKTAIGNTNAEEIAATRMNTLRGSWEIFLGVVETLTLGIGDKFIPVVRTVVDWLTGLAQKYGPPVIEMFGGMADVVVALTNYVVAFLTDGDYLNDWLTHLPEPIRGVTMGIIGTVAAVRDFTASVQNTFAPIIDMISNFVSWKDILIVVGGIIATIVIPAIGAFIVAAAPAIAIFAALVAASALLRNAWENDWLGIRTKTGEAFAYLTATFGQLGSFIKFFGGTALGEIVAWAKGNETQFFAVRAIWESTKIAFGKVFTDMTAKLKEWGAVAWAEFAERFPGAAEALQKAWAGIRANFAELWAVIQPLIVKLVDTFKALTKDWQTGSTDMGTALQTAKVIIDGVLSVMVAIVSMTINNMISSLKLVAQLLTGDWAGAWQTAKGIVTTTLDTLKGVVSTVFKTILGVLGISVDDVSTWRDNVVELFQRAGQNILALMAGIKAAVIEPVKAFITATSDKITEWKNWIVERWQLIKEAATEKWLAIKAAVVDPVTAFISTTIGKINDWKEWLVTKFTDIWTAVKKVLNPSFWLELGKDMIQGLWDGIKNAWNGFTSWLNNAWQSIKDKVNQVFGRNSPSTWFAELGIDMMAGLSGGISDAIPSVTAVFEGLSTNISNSMSSITSTLTTQINSAMTSVVEGVRYGAGLVNQATADVLAQSRAAELASRNAWEAMQTAARQAALNMPALPPPVGVPAGQLLGNNAPAPGSIIQAPTPLPGMPGMPVYTPPPPPPPPTPFDEMFTTEALREVIGGANVTAAMNSIEEFGRTIDELLPSMWERTQEERSAVNTLSINPGAFRIDDVLAAVQTLIQAILTRGLGNQFNITGAPGDRADNQTELEDLVAFLAAQYAT